MEDQISERYRVTKYIQGKDLEDWEGQYILVDTDIPNGRVFLIGDYAANTNDWTKEDLDFIAKCLNERDKKGEKL